MVGVAVVRRGAVILEEHVVRVGVAVAVAVGVVVAVGVPGEPTGWRTCEVAVAVGVVVAVGGAVAVAVGGAVAVAVGVVVAGRRAGQVGVPVRVAR